MKHYSTASNVWYLLQLLVQYDWHCLVFLILLLLVNLSMPMLATLLPTTAVAALTHGGGIRQYLLSILSIMALYAVETFLSGYLEQQITLSLRDFRTSKAMSMLMKKALTMDYCVLEPAEGQQKLSAAIHACNGNYVGVEGLLSHLEPWLRNLLGMLIYGAAAVVLDWRILPILIGMTLINHFIARQDTQLELRTKPTADKDLYGQHYLHRQAADPANGKDIRLYHMENWFLSSLLACIKRRDIWRRQLFVWRNARAVSDNLFLVFRDILVYTMLVKSFFSGDIDAAGFTLAIGIISTFTTWLNGFVNAANDWRFENLEVGDFRYFLEQKDVLNHCSSTDIPVNHHPPRIELRDVSFSYPSSQQPVLNHLNLTIQSGENIALVGLNGAGKTTLVKLLSGLYRPASGQILINGIPVEDFDIQNYYQLVGTIYQDVHLLPFTIGENVAGCEDYDSLKVWNCLEKAGMKEVIEKLPKKLDTCLSQKLEPDGVDLSGGQQQRLLFARVLYKNAPLLILDEPTAALDPLAEADLYQKYAQATKDKTSIFISHRLSSTQFCDRVIYMENGFITETGTHQELLKRDGAYARLFQLQSYYYQSQKEVSHENT